IPSHAEKTVGASLLAKASAHSTPSSPDTPLSRASPLPQ
ncbi:metal ABC transporter ATP-binding protein, partial [Pseudomonas koreensis]